MIKKPLSRQTGLSAVMFALLLPVMMAFTALAINAGYKGVVKNRLQNVADAAATACVILAKTSAPCGNGGSSSTVSQNTHSSMAAINPEGYTIRTEYRTSCPNPATQGTNCARATVSTQYSDYFTGGVVGRGLTQISASAVAGSNDSVQSCFIAKTGYESNGGSSLTLNNCGAMIGGSGLISMSSPGERILVTGDQGAGIMVYDGGVSTCPNCSPLPVASSQTLSQAIGQSGYPSEEELPSFPTIPSPTMTSFGSGVGAGSVDACSGGGCTYQPGIHSTASVNALNDRNNTSHIFKPGRHKFSGAINLPAVVKNISFGAGIYDFAAFTTKSPVTFTAGSEYTFGNFTLDESVAANFAAAKYKFSGDFLLNKGTVQFASASNNNYVFDGGFVTKRGTQVTFGSANYRFNGAVTLASNVTLGSGGVYSGGVGNYVFNQGLNASSAVLRQDNYNGSATQPTGSNGVTLWVPGGKPLSISDVKLAAPDRGSSLCTGGAGSAESWVIYNPLGSPVQGLDMSGSGTKIDLIGIIDLSGHNVKISGSTGTLFNVKGSFIANRLLLSGNLNQQYSDNSCFNVYQPSGAAIYN